MEISLQGQSLSVPDRPSFDRMDRKNSLETDEIAKTSSSGQRPASVRVLDALQRLSESRKACLEQHANAVGVFFDVERSEKNGESLPSQRARNAQALHEASEAVSLGMLLDQPRENAALKDLLRSSTDLFSEPECASMTCDDPGMVNALSQLLEEDVGGDNLREIWEQLAASIEKFNSGTLNNFYRVAQLMKEFYEAINSASVGIDKKIQQDGENNIKFDSTDLRTALEKIWNQFSPKNDEFNEKNTAGGPFDTEQAAKDLFEKLQMVSGEDSIFVIKQAGFPDRKWYICISSDIVKKMLDNLPGNGSISMATFNLWKSTYDVLVRRIEDAMQERAQKYSNTYSRFESYHKTILSIIQAFTDMMRSFFPF